MYNDNRGGMGAAGISAGISTLLSSYIVKKYQLDMTHFGVLYTMLKLNLY